MLLTGFLLNDPLRPTVPNASLKALGQASAKQEGGILAMRIHGNQGVGSSRCVDGNYMHGQRGKGGSKMLIEKRCSISPDGGNAGGNTGNRMYKGLG